MTTNTQILWHRPEGQRQVDASFYENVDPSTETLLPLLRKCGSISVEKCLPRRSLIKMAGDHNGEEVSCLSGVVWITQPGDPEDILICPGESFIISQKGTVVIQGIVEARLKITSFNMIF